jgi:hypothetical protein
VSLFEDGEAARQWFERVVSTNPSSPFAATSSLWIQVLRDDQTWTSHEPQRRACIDPAALWVLEWMERQLTVRVTPEKVIEAPKTDMVQSLSSQVQDRDRRIAELRPQLNALRAIDRKQVDKRRRLRLSSIITPMEETLR